MNQGLWGFLQQIPWPIVAGFLATQLIPYLSQLATKAPSWATGMVTLALSVADSFLSTLAASKGHFDWKAALVGSIVFSFAAFGHHALAISKTSKQAWLIAHGNPGPAPTPQQRPA